MRRVSVRFTIGAVGVAAVMTLGAAATGRGAAGPGPGGFDEADDDAPLMSAVPEIDWDEERGAGDDPAASKVGLIRTSAGAAPGYTLFAPLDSTVTYLVDNNGRLVHSWNSRYEPGHAVHLLPDGTLLRSARDSVQRHFRGGGLGGRVERLAPDGTVLWEFAYVDESHCLHHDIEPLPNGNILMIAWEKKSRKEVLAAGRDPELMESGELWPDCIIEVRPEGGSGGTIVWEWHAWDHLVQDLFPGKPGFGEVADHPELIDLNYRSRAPRETPAELRRLRALGYVGGGEPDDDDEDDDQPPGPRRAAEFDIRADWLHTNSVDYNAELDQIVLSVHSFSEIWIIDHGTTTAEAAGHNGGRYGRGGDLLYRWGNPRAYGAGDESDQQLFEQHDARWIPDGRPGAGNLTIFNNGRRPRGMPYSSVLEITPPVNQLGQYAREPGRAYGPERPAWVYTAANKRDFFSGHLSGAERLWNGNTLVCSGEQARIFEVDLGGEVVWEFVNPYEPRRVRPPPTTQRAATSSAPRGPASQRRSPAGRPASGMERAGSPSTRPAHSPERDAVRPLRPGAAPRQMQARRPMPPDGPPPDGILRPPPGPGRAVGPPGGPPRGGGLFRATRLAPQHPGIERLLGTTARE